MNRTKDWYSFEAFNFSQNQTLWALSHLQLLRDGFWPPEHRETGYTGTKGNKGRKHAPFENAAIIAAEIDKRIVAIGLDGILLEYIYSNPQNYYENVQHVANALRVPTDEIFQRMRKTLERMTA